MVCGVVGEGVTDSSAVRCGIFEEGEDVYAKGAEEVADNGY